MESKRWNVQAFKIFRIRCGFWRISSYIYRVNEARAEQIKVMIRDKVETKGPIVIDLTGPDGNAFALLAYGKRLAKQLDFEDIPGLLQEMQAGNYEHLLQVFDKHFGDFVILER